jgi:hypothetical protein
MTPADAIQSIDRQIAAHGQVAKLERAKPAFSGNIPVFHRGYRPDELSGGIQQGDSTAILSPTNLAVAGVPKRLDKLTVGGRKRNIEAAEPVYMNDVLVRVNLWLRG